MDLEKARQTVIQGSEFLKNNAAFIDAGTLLGIFRDGDLIPHDTDVDFAISFDSLEDFSLPDVPLEWSLLRTIFWESRPMQLAYVTNGIVLDFYFFYGDINIETYVNVNEHGRLIVPRSHFDSLETFSWNGMNTPVPALTEKYLELRYGIDWRTPSTSKENWEYEATNLSVEWLHEDTPKLVLRDFSETGLLRNLTFNLSAWRSRIVELEAEIAVLTGRLEDAKNELGETKPDVNREFCQAAHCSITRASGNALGRMLPKK